MLEKIFQLDKFLDILEVRVIDYKEYTKEEFQHYLKMLFEDINDVFALDNEIKRVAFNRNYE